MLDNVTILNVMEDPALFGDWFQDESWRSWKVFLEALFALPMNADDVVIYERHTKRAAVPSAAFREAWAVVGRRGGKSLIAAALAVFLAVFKDYLPYLAAGEMATIAVIAADRKQARTILRFVRGFLKLPMLRDLVVNDTQEAIELKGQVQIEVQTGSFRSTRGYTFAAVIGDEIAFWRSEDSANPDEEILKACRPGLATLPGSLLLLISSPYSRRGALWKAYSKHFGKDSARVLVWQGTTLEMNPSIDPAIIEEAMEEDPAAANAEYNAQFRSDLESYIDALLARSLVIPNRLELLPAEKVRYYGFADPAGGSGRDSYTMAIAHTENDQHVLDLLREVKPPFSPEQTTMDFAADFKRYRITKVIGDKWAGQWPVEKYRQYGITYEQSAKPKSEIYKDTLPLFNSRKVDLIDNPRLLAQLCGLERRTRSGGNDSIDHQPNSHDDCINSACGVLLLTAGTKVRSLSEGSIVGTPRPSMLQLMPMRRDF